jgi:hypothetical protein
MHQSSSTCNFGLLGVEEAVVLDEEAPQNRRLQAAQTLSWGGNHSIL